MDLPPPPPHRRHDHHHLRYENVLRPPDIFSQPNPHYFPPPPHTRSLNTLLPPPPMRNMSPPPLSQRFAFSPPLYHVTERSHRYELDPPPKPYFDPTRLPPPPPPPPPPPAREKKPLRIVLDHRQRNSFSETENFPRGRIDIMRELPDHSDRVMRWPAADVHTSAPGFDVGGRDIYPESSELYEMRDDGRRRSNGVSDWGYDLDNYRDYDERRWCSGMSDRSHDMYRDCYYDERRRDSGMNDGTRDNQGHQLYIQVNDDEARRDSSWSAGVLSRLGNRHSDFFENDLSFGGVLSRLGNRQPEFAENDVSLGGILSGLGNRRPEFDENDPSLGGVLSRLGNRKPEFDDDDLSLGRFRGRLGVNKGKFIRKQRLQKKNKLLKAQLGKVRSKHSGGSNAQHFTKDSNGGSFKVKEKRYGKMQTRMENEREREQSPMELAISFKSNALVAKAIQAPSNPSTELCEKSNSVKERLGCHAALPAIKSVVVSDIQSDSWETSKEYMDKAFDSGSVSVAANCARDSVEMALENARLKVMTQKGSTMEGSEKTCSRRSRKRKKFMDRSEDAFEVPRHADENFSSNKSASYGDRLGLNQYVIITSNNEAPQLADENFSSNKSASYEDRLGFNQHVNITSNYIPDKTSVYVAEEGEIGYIPDKTSVYEAEEGEIVPTDQIIELDSDRDHRVHVVSEDMGVPSEDMVSIKDHDPAGFPKTRISEVHEDNYFSENHKLVPSPKSACKVMKMTEDSVFSDVGFKDANSGGFLPNKCNTLRIILAAKESKSLEGPAVKVSSPDNMGTVLSHNINSVEGGETCFYNDNLFPKGTTDHETCLSVDKSSKIIRKRKHASDQMGLLSGTKTTVNVRTDRLRSIVTRCLAEDIVPAVDGDFVGEKDSCKEDTSLQQGSSGVKDSHLKIDFSANGFPGNQKKQALCSPRSSLSSLSEDDTTAGGVSNPLILEQPFSRISGWEAEQCGNTSPASITISQCETTGVEGEVGTIDLSVVSLDENMLDGDSSLGNDDLALNASGLFISERNGPSGSDSGYESLASSFDMRSCMTSPEELHVNPDSSFLENTKASTCLLDNVMICQSDNISDKKHVFADPNTSSHRKCLGTAVSKSQSNIGIPQSLLKDTGQVVKKLYPIHGKLTWSKNQVTSVIAKVLPVQHRHNLSNPRKFYSSHATKSRTWCRTVNSTAAVAEPKIEPSPIPQSNGTSAARFIPSSYIRKGNSLVRKDSPSDDASHGVPGSSSVYQLSHCTNTRKNDLATDCIIGDANAPTVKRRGQVNTSVMTKAVTLNPSGNSLKCTPCHLEEPLSLSNPHINDCPPRSLDVTKEKIKSSVVSECQTDSVFNSDSQSTARDRNSEKKIIYVKRRSNQLVATCNSGDMSVLGVDNTRSQLSDGYYKNRGNQLLRALSENHAAKENTNATVSGLVPQSVVPKTSTRRQSAFAKSCRYSKFSLVWKLQDSQSSEKYRSSLGPRKVWPRLFSSKRAAYWRSLMLGIKPSLSNISQKLLVSRKRGAIYTRSSHGYSLKMSKVLSVGGSSLKWSKSIEKSSREANEEATRAVAAAEKRKKEEKGSLSIASKSRNHVSRKWVLSVKLRPGERIFRIGSERYKMDPTKRTLQRITEKEPSSSVALQSKKNVKRSYIPRRLLIGNEEYVRIGNGNQLVRDPKKRIRVLANEKVRWSLRTARLRLARKRKYCQFFTRFGKCNKDDGKCPYIHDPSKIVVCTKFLTGSCTNINCKLTHKVIPERMQDCSYFLKGSCSNENCPYRHVHVNPDSSVCESFLRGYCADGNECQKKHTYVCPAFEATGVCPQASTCKLHHPKMKTEKKPANEPKIVRGRYFDGGLVEVDECSTSPAEKLSSKGKDNMVVLEGKFPDYISLEVSGDEVDQALILEARSDEIMQNGDDDVR